MTQLRNSHNTTIKRLNRPKKFTSSDHNLNSESLIKNVYTAILKFKTIYYDAEIHFIFKTCNIVIYLHFSNVLACFTIKLSALSI